MSPQGLIAFNMSSEVHQVITSGCRSSWKHGLAEFTDLGREAWFRVQCGFMSCTAIFRQMMRAPRALWSIRNTVSIVHVHGTVCAIGGSFIPWHYFTSLFYCIEYKMYSWSPLMTESLKCLFVCTLHSEAHNQKVIHYGTVYKKISSLCVCTRVNKSTIGHYIFLVSK